MSLKPRVGENHSHRNIRPRCHRRGFLLTRVYACVRLREVLTEERMNHEQVIDAILLRLSEIERHCRSKVTREELVDLIATIKEEWK